MIERDVRASVAAIARTWKMTRYVDQARILGVGADCTFVAKVYQEAGLIPDFEVGPYSPQWCLHRSEEKYLAEIVKHAREIDITAAGIGDLLLYRWGRTWSHTAIVVDPGYPQIVHAYKDAGFVIEDTADAGRLADAPRRCFTVIRPDIP